MVLESGFPHVLEIGELLPVLGLSLSATLLNEHREFSLSFQGFAKEVLVKALKRLVRVP